MKLRVHKEFCGKTCVPISDLISFEMINGLGCIGLVFALNSIYSNESNYHKNSANDNTVSTIQRYQIGHLKCS